MSLFTISKFTNGSEILTNYGKQANGIKLVSMVLVTVTKSSA